jgi:hypothetical protein
VLNSIELSRPQKELNNELLIRMLLSFIRVASRTGQSS